VVKKGRTKSTGKTQYKTHQNDKGDLKQQLEQREMPVKFFGQ
jgi:hypothetical protein